MKKVRDNWSLLLIGVFFAVSIVYLLVNGTAVYVQTMVDTRDIKSPRWQQHVGLSRVVSTIIVIKALAYCRDRISTVGSQTLG